jgi:hypothetical protein
MAKAEEGQPPPTQWLELELEGRFLQRLPGSPCRGILISVRDRIKGHCEVAFPQEWEWTAWLLCTLLLCHRMFSVAFLWAVRYCAVSTWTFDYLSMCPIDVTAG